MLNNALFRVEEVQDKEEEERRRTMILRTRPGSEPKVVYGI